MEIVPSSMLIKLLAESIGGLVITSRKVTEGGEIDVIRAEAEKQETTLRMAEAQAKVAQELAIARRIETAEEVEIDEYYDYSGDAHAGLKTDGNSLNLGMGAAGKRISKRVYRFKGKSIIDPNQAVDSTEETKLISE